MFDEISDPSIASFTLFRIRELEDEATMKSKGRAQNFDCFGLGYDLFHDTHVAISGSIALALNLSPFMGSQTSFELHRKMNLINTNASL